MNLVDSSGWIEYLAGGANARFFRRPIESEEPLLVPTLCLFEVYRHLLRHVGRDEALRVLAAMRRREVVTLDEDLALAAAELSVAAGLAMADSVMLATARAYGAEFWTQDADFQGMEGVRFRAK